MFHFQYICDNLEEEDDKEHRCLDTVTTSSATTTSTLPILLPQQHNCSNKNMSCLTVTIEQVSYSMSSTFSVAGCSAKPSSVINFKNIPESCLVTCNSSTAMPTACNNSTPSATTMAMDHHAPTVTFSSTAGFWQKAPQVSLELDYPGLQQFHTSVADTNRRELDENGEETQSFAWGNSQQFDL